MTNEELSALPEFQDYELETLPTGETIRHRKVRKFVMYKPKDDDVLLFHDKDGSWFVVYHLEGGPYKRKALL
jgi:hypothetical protein